MKRGIKILLFAFLIYWEVGFLINIPKYSDLSSVIMAIILMSLPIILLITINKKKTIDRTTTAVNNTNINIHTPQSEMNNAFHINSLEIHQDIVGLIWIGDGEYQNYHFDTKKIGDNFFQSNRIEPSVIYINLPISKPHDKNLVPSPDYYPSYEGLTPEQRWVYWEFLKNPYDNNIDIGYVFIFYYGLERFILKNNRDDAFYMVLKLRAIHKNTSFQSYSLDHLVYACISKNRKDWASSLSELIIRKQVVNASPNLIMMFKYQLGIPLSVWDIIQHSSKFGFSNRRYINMYPDMFSSILGDLLVDTYGTPYIYLNIFFNDNNIKKLEKSILPICANYSLSPREYSVPDIFSNEQFKINIFNKLQDTHEILKKELVTLRKKK